jgi:hypothetical protein
MLFQQGKEEATTKTLEISRRLGQLTVSVSLNPVIDRLDRCRPIEGGVAEYTVANVAK